MKFKKGDLVKYIQPPYPKDKNQVFIVHSYCQETFESHRICLYITASTYIFGRYAWEDNLDFYSEEMEIFI